MTSMSQAFLSSKDALSTDITVDGGSRVAVFNTNAVGPALSRYLSGVQCAQAQRPVASDISAIVPVYNTDPRFLHYCIDSICRQTLLPAEVIIVDDCSSRPDTLQYLEQLQTRTFFRLIRNERNLSLGSSMNRGLTDCRTRYALKLDSDDAMAPSLVSTYQDHLVRHGEIDVLGCQFTAFGDHSYTTRHPFRVTKRYVIDSPGYWFVNHTGVLLNRSSVLGVGGYRQLRGHAEDYDLWIRMMLRGYTRFYNLPGSLVEYREHSEGLHRGFKRGRARIRLALSKKFAYLAPSF